MSLTTNCKSEKGCKIPLNLCTSVNQTVVIECLQETKVKIIKKLIMCRTVRIKQHLKKDHHQESAVKKGRFLCTFCSTSDYHATSLVKHCHIVHDRSIGKQKLLLIIR